MLVEGSGKIGFVKGEGVLSLILLDGGTEVSYDGEAQIGGSIASVGQRLIDTTSKLLVKRFFKKLAKIGSGEPDTDEASTPDA
jgi:carbon monoxide dehydrogenase subunit G